MHLENSFQFNENNYFQTNATAMDTCMAVTFAKNKKVNLAFTHTKSTISDWLKTMAHI